MVLVRAAILGCMGTAVSVGLLALWLRPNSVPHRLEALAYLGMILCAGAAAALEPRRSAADDPATLRLSFVPTFASLLLFGPVAMTLVAIVATATRALTARPGSLSGRRALLDFGTAVLASQFAGSTYIALDHLVHVQTWPMKAVPVAGAVLAFCAVTAGAAAVLIPLLTGGHGPSRSALRALPGHVVAAAMVVGIIELVTRGAWRLTPVVAVPVFFAWWIHRDLAGQADRRQSNREAAEAADQAMAVVDGQGRITVWNAPLERMLAYPATRAVHRPVDEVVRALTSTELSMAVAGTLADGAPRTCTQLACQTPGGTRQVQVTVLADVDGSAVLLWRDATGHAQAEASLRQAAERLAGVAAGANDGLWDWDARAERLYLSARWNEIAGLPAVESVGPQSDWFARVHPDDLPDLSTSIEAHASGRTPVLQHEHRLRHEDGTYRRVQCRAVAVRDSRGRALRIAGSLTDISDQALARMLGGGVRDSLTGLSSRAAFVERLGERLRELQAGGGSRFAVLYMDLDRFKVVNDSLGHLAGDELLVAASRRLESCLRPHDDFARLGGDEFAILVHAIGDVNQANVIAFRIQEALSAPFTIGGREVVVSASIGIAFSRPEYEGPDEIMRDADTAMYQAKAHGKARHELFDADMHARALDRLALEDDLRRAVKAADFEVHYQPIVELSSRQCVGFESLVRWTRNGKLVSPAEFVPLAEELGIVAPLGTWVLQQACRQFVDWRRRYPAAGLDCITVNVSARQLVQQGFPYVVEQTLQQTGINPSDLRLEITETALMDSPQHAAQVLKELRQLGVCVYLDDFGTGYSSLSHLHKLPVDALKIDRSFVRGLLVDERPAMVESILALARTLKTSVIAEGVEDERQARELERLGCTRAQGYFFSRPVAAGAIEVLLADGRPLGDTRAHSAFTAA